MAHNAPPDPHPKGRTELDDPAIRARSQDMIAEWQRLCRRYGDAPEFWAMVRAALPG